MDAPTEISNKSKLLEQERSLLKKDRRKVLHGYPRLTPLSIDEVPAYLNQDTIDCLICGQRKKSLATHLSRIHRIPSDEYKERFGLPFRAGLTSAPTNQSLKAVRAKDSASTITARISRLTPVKSGAIHKQRTSQFKTMCALRNSAMATPTPRQYDRADAAQVLQALEAGEMLYPYLRQTSGMSVTTFKVLLREHPDLYERYRLICGAARRIAMLGNVLARKNAATPI